MQNLISLFLYGQKSEKYTNYYLFSCFESVYNFLLYIRSLNYSTMHVYIVILFSVFYNIYSDLKNVLFLPQARLPLVGIDFEPTVVYNSGAKARDTFFAQ